SAASKSTDSTAVLHNGTDPIYRILLVRDDPNLANTAAAVMSNPANTLGDPNFDKPVDAMNNPVSRIKSTWLGDGTAQKVAAAGPAFNPDPLVSPNAGFYLLGPAVKFLPNADPGFVTLSAKSPQMSFGVPVIDPLADTPPKPTVILQRLANPALPPNNAPG